MFIRRATVRAMSRDLGALLYVVVAVLMALAPISVALYAWIRPDVQVTGLLGLAVGMGLIGYAFMTGVLLPRRIARSVES